jgi:hypothetical protein
MPLTLQRQLSTIVCAAARCSIPSKVGGLGDPLLSSVKEAEGADQRIRGCSLVDRR